MFRFSFVFVFPPTKVVRILISLYLYLYQPTQVVRILIYLYLYFYQPRWWGWPGSGPTSPLPPLQAGQPRTVDQAAPELHLDVLFYSFPLKIFLFSFVSIKTRWPCGSRTSSFSQFFTLTFAFRGSNISNILWCLLRLVDQSPQEFHLDLFSSPTTLVSAVDDWADIIMIMSSLSHISRLFGHCPWFLSPNHNSAIPSFCIAPHSKKSSFLTVHQLTALSDL